MLTILFAWIFKRPIAWVAMFFIALAILCNIVVMSVSEGMRTSFIEQARTGCPDFTMNHYQSVYTNSKTSRYDQDFYDDAIQLLRTELKEENEKLDVHALRQLESIALAYVPGEKISKKEPVQVRGVDQKSFINMFQNKTDLVGTEKIFNTNSNPIPVIVGLDVYYSLGVKNNDILDLAIVTPFRLGDLLKKEEIKTVSVKVVQVADFSSFWNKSIFMSLDSMQKVMNRSGDASMLSSVFLKISNDNGMSFDTRNLLESAEERKQLINIKLNKLGSRDYGYFHVKSWFEEQRWLTQNMLEISMVQLIILIVLLLASCATYLMIHLLMKEKVRTIGLLMALGTSTFRIFLLVLSYGFILSLFGSLIGCLAGYFFMENIESISVFVIGTKELFSVYGMDGLPVEEYLYIGNTKILINLLVSVLITLMCTFSAIFPAIIASRIQPAQVLKSVD